MKAIAGFLAGFIVAIGFSGYGTELFTEAGQCRFGLEKDGNFYQQQRHTDNYMTPRCLSLGVADKFNDGPWGWRASVQVAGKIEARDNVAAIGIELVPPHFACDQATSFGCTSNFNGSGRTWGFTAGITNEQRLGFIRVIGESGLFFFTHRFRARQTNIDYAPVGGANGEYDETSKLWDMPSPFLGLTLRYGDVYLAARHYWPTGHRALSLTNHEMNQIVVGVVKAL